MLVFTVAVCLFSVVAAYPEGPPLAACKDMFPTLHNATAKTTPVPFDIKIDSSKSTYSPNQELKVTLMVKSGENTYYEGLFLQMRRVSGNKDEPIGSFMLSQNVMADLQTMNCGGNSMSAVSQKRKQHFNNHTVTWKAPAGDEGDLRIKGTIVHETEEFWVGVYSKTLEFTSAASTPAVATGLLVIVAALATFFSF